MFAQHSLIAGGAGFIGFHLSRWLLTEGWHVTCVDDLSSGCKDNVQVLANDFPDTYFFLEKDVCGDLSGLSQRYAIIYNLASPASPKHYVKCPIKTIESNVIGTANLLKIAERDCAVLIQASTSEVYGDPSVHPQSECYWGNVNPVGQRSCYDEGKRAAEALVSAYRLERGVDGRIVRIFNTYGPRMRLDDGRVVTNFICNALTGDKLYVYGNGEQTRSFSYIDDTVRALILSGERDLDWPKAVNIGNPEEVSILSLAEEIVDLVGCGTDSIEFRSLPIADDPRKRCPDIKLAEILLNWRPSIGLRDGLIKTLDYYTDFFTSNAMEEIAGLESFDV